MEKTLAKFIVGEYERLKKENDDLRYIVECFEDKNHNGGFTDLNKKTKAVRYFVENEYAAFGVLSHWNEYGLDELKQLLELDDDALYEEATIPGMTEEYKAIKEETHEFPFTVLFETYKESTVYCYDPDHVKDMLVYVTKDACVGDWVMWPAAGASRRMAVQEVRDMIRKRVEELERSDG